MESKAEEAREMEFTRENWDREFGKEQRVKTPLGFAKLGENQYEKIRNYQREGYFSMIKPTLEHPDVVLEKSDPRVGAERNSKFMFVKTFQKSDGSRVVHFVSVTVSVDGKEVSISSHEKTAKGIKKRC